VWFFRYASKQTNKQTGTLITILCIRTGEEEEKEEEEEEEDLQRKQGAAF